MRRRANTSKKESTKKALTPEEKAARRKRRRRRWRRGLLIFVVVLILARIALPYVVLHFTNKKLASLEGYYGHIDDIDISLYRGAYTIKRLELLKIDKGDTFDFVYAKTIDLAIEWKPIWRGELVGKVKIDSSSVVYTVEKNDYKDIVKDTADFRDVMNSFMPLTLNKLEVTNSVVHYKDPMTSPKLDIMLTNIHVVAMNLVNAYDSTSLLPATIDASGNLYKGNVDMHMKIDPFADESKFDMNASVKRVHLPSLNDMLRAYANVDVNTGTFEVYTEVATKNGKVNGYVKPLIHDLDVATWKKEEGNIGQRIYENLIGGVAWLFKNHRRDQLGSKVYIRGDLNDPKVSIGKAVIVLLQNAFISALKPYVDGEISIGSVNAQGDSNAIDRFLDKRKDKKEERQAKRAQKKKKKKSG